MEKGIVLGLANTITDQDIVTLKSANCNLVRLEASGAADTPTINHVVDNGIRVITLIPLEIVAGATKDDWQAPLGSPAFNTYVKNYALACGVLAAAFPIPFAWELLNEWASFGKDHTLKPEQYAELYGAAYPAIRAYSKAPISTGGLYTWWDPAQPEEKKRAYSEVDNLVQVIALLQQRNPPIDIDLAALHLYVSSGGKIDTVTVDEYLGFYEGATKKPLLVTEAGWESGVVGEEIQADNLRDLFTLCEGHRVAACCWFCLRDFTDKGPDGRPKLETWGLETSDSVRRQKAAFLEYNGTRQTLVPHLPDTPIPAPPASPL